MAKMPKRWQVPKDRGSRLVVKTVSHVAPSTGGTSSAVSNGPPLRWVGTGVGDGVALSLGTLLVVLEDGLDDLLGFSPVSDFSPAQPATVMTSTAANVTARVSPWAGGATASE
jgi:hypothetical protein